MVTWSLTFPRFAEGSLGIPSYTVPYEPPPIVHGGGKEGGVRDVSALRLKHKSESLEVVGVNKHPQHDILLLEHCRRHAWVRAWTRKEI
jgi:hypothetical protein